MLFRDELTDTHDAPSPILVGVLASTSQRLIGDFSDPGSHSKFIQLAGTNI